MWAALESIFLARSSDHLWKETWSGRYSDCTSALCSVAYYWSWVLNEVSICCIGSVAWVLFLWEWLQMECRLFSASNWVPKWVHWHSLWAQECCSLSWKIVLDIYLSPSMQYIILEDCFWHIHLCQECNVLPREIVLDRHLSLEMQYVILKDCFQYAFD